MDYIEILGFVAAGVTTFAAVPQFMKTIKTQQTRDISLWSVLILLFGMSLWLIYGIMKPDLPLIGANAIGVIAWIIVLSVKIKNG